MNGGSGSWLGSCPRIGRSLRPSKSSGSIAVSVSLVSRRPGSSSSWIPCRAHHPGSFGEGPFPGESRSRGHEEGPSEGGVRSGLQVSRGATEGVVGPRKVPWRRTPNFDIQASFFDTRSRVIAVGAERTGALADLDRAVFDGERDCFELRVDPQLAQDVAYVGLHRLRTDVELSSVVVVALALREATE